MQRRWRAPSLPEWGLEATDGAAVLNENVGGLGVLLWDAARDVVLWATSPRDGLEHLFAPAAERMRTVSVLSSGVDPLLEGSLLVLAWLVGQPCTANRERVMIACRTISVWADGRGALATASAFAHAAAAVCPGSARSSYEAGRFARRRAEYAQAEAWLVRAVLLGRQSQDWDSCINARGGLGNLYIQRGNYPRAERHHRRALGLAQRQGLRELEGHALHSLCGIAVEVGRKQDINRYARLAYEAFGPGHPRLPTLAHDVAYGWMELGYFARAIEIFEAAKPHFRRDQYVLVLANICRAAAGLGDVERFHTAWIEVQSWMEGEASQEYVPQTLLDLARAAAMLKLWQQALDMAERAHALAAERHEARVQFTAETVIESIRSEQAIEAYTNPRDTTSQDTTITEEINTLAKEFVGSLTEFAAAGV